jgi:uncharacterized protein YecT (DUF1311 family)
MCHNASVLTAGFVLLASLLPTVAQAKINCATAMTTPELNYCADQGLEAADAELNAAYKKAIAYIRTTGSERPYDPRSWEKALRASQQAWVAFRDAECAGLVPMAFSGGTITTSAVLGCKTTMTEARTKALISIYKGD